MSARRNEAVWSKSISGRITLLLGHPRTAVGPTASSFDLRSMINKMVEESPTDWKKAGQTFDSVPEDYDTFRPGYPAELVDCILETSRIPPAGKILEVGAGTGKATRPFAERGFSILCIEPGVNLAAKAALNLKAFPGVQFEIIRFEDWPGISGIFDLVLSAQAFHWVPKEIGFLKAAGALKPGGYLALFWNMYPGLENQVAAEFGKIYQEIGQEVRIPLTHMEETIQNRTSDIESSGLFGPVLIRRFPWTTCYTTKQYQGLLNTYSDHLCLPPKTRQFLYDEISKVIDRYGGSIERPYVAVLFMAQKLSQ